MVILFVYEESLGSSSIYCLLCYPKFVVNLLSSLLKYHFVVSSTVLMAGLLLSYGASQNLHRKAEPFIQTPPSESQLSK